MATTITHAKVKVLEDFSIPLSFFEENDADITLKGGKVVIWAGETEVVGGLDNDRLNVEQIYFGGEGSYFWYEAMKNSAELFQGTLDVILFWGGGVWIEHVRFDLGMFSSEYIDL